MPVLLGIVTTTLCAFSAARVANGGALAVADSACLEHVDALLAQLLESFRGATTVLTADHGDAGAKTASGNMGSPIAVLWRCHC